MSLIVGESSDVIATFMQQVIVEYHNFAASHRRIEPREAIAVPVMIQPVNAEIEPLGQAVKAITRDISYGGIAVFHTEKVDSPYLRISIVSPESRSQMQLLAKIEHQTPCGGFQIIGCRFVSDQPEGDDGVELEVSDS